MGKIYKLAPQIKEFVLEKKKSEPNLSCRQLAILILDKFQIRISKSSVNFIVKSSGLSMPIGRRCKKKKQSSELIKFPLEVKMATPLLKLPEQPVEEPLVEPIISQIAPQSEEPIAETVSSCDDKLKEKSEELHIEPPIEEMSNSMPMDKPVEESHEIAFSFEEPIEKAVEMPSVEMNVEESTESFCSGAILLKAADCLAGGLYSITEVIKNRLNLQSDGLFTKTECLLYGSLFGAEEKEQLSLDSGLWGLIMQRFNPEDVRAYLNELQKTIGLSSDISKVISAVFQEVRYLKIKLANENVMYLDGQMHTIWSTPSIPYDFASTIYNVKSYIKKYFQEDMPFVFSMAPGYDTPTEEFFNFILSLNLGGKRKIDSLDLCGNKFEELESIRIEPDKKRFFIFGLWPWQFADYRRVNRISEFNPFYSSVLKKDFYIADIDIELSQPALEQSVMLKGYALKAEPAGKVRLIILSNFSDELARHQNLVDTYFNRWPNLEETFRDFSRKIELFTYTADSQHFFSTENLNSLIHQESLEDIRALFAYYLKALDLYGRWHFFPAGYEERDFAMMNKYFYSLRAQAKREKDSLLVTLQPPSDFPFSNDLEYVCSRINEREVVFPGGKRLWLST